MKKFVFTIISFFLIKFANSQTFFPNENPVYNDKIIPRIDIFIDPASLEEIYANVDSELEFPVTFVFYDGNISDTMYNVGFRLRGNTSRDSEKKSFKVSFDSYVAQEFYGMDKMNLNGEHNDPSIIRTKLVWDLLHDYKVPASRSNHVDLYINYEFYGLYMNVEHVDNEFLEARYGNSDGNLYKCLYPADLSYINNNPDSYKLENDGRRVYELKTNETADDYSDLAEFIDIINNTQVNQFPEVLEPVFNVNLYLKTLAAEVITSHWDDYAFNKNNFYLYHNTKTGKLDYLSYDVDNTFGIDWFGITWAERNIYTWYNEYENRPLTKRLLQNSDYRQRFSFYIDLLLDEYFVYSEMSDKIDEIKAMITPSVEDDYYRTLDYGWDMDDFNNSYTQALGDHVKSGLKPYISTRISKAIQQLSSYSVSPLISIVNFSDYNYSESFKTEILVEGDGNITNSLVMYRLNDGSWQSVTLNDSGYLPDTLANDDVYSAFIPNYANTSKIDFYYEITDNDNKKTREPYQGFYSVTREVIDIPELYINEVMANNLSTISDEFGEFEDWVEIYNPKNADFSLANIYLTDNISNPNKWQFPDIGISASGFILVWCDTTTSQGNLHTNFKLSRKGEELGLYFKSDDEYILLDSVKFLSQEADISFGRKTDGEIPFVYFSTPTPNLTNNQSTDYYAVITVFPNPCKSYINISASGYNLENAYLSDLSGKKIIIEYSSDENKIYTENLQSGMYILTVEVNSDEGNIVQKNIKIIKN